MRLHKKEKAPKKAIKKEQKQIANKERYKWIGKEKDLKKELDKAKKGIGYQIQRRIGKSIAIVFVVIGIMAILVMRNMAKDINDTELIMDSKTASFQLAEYFAPFARMTEQLAISPETQRLMKTTSVAKNITKNSGYIDVYENMVRMQTLDSENILAVWIGDADASVLTQSDGYTSEEGWDITERPWYSCLEAGHTIITEPYIDASTGTQILSVASPVYDSQGNHLGVAGMDISINKVINMMEEYKIGTKGYSILISETGVIVYHPNQDVVGTMIQDMDISPKVLDAIETKTEKLIYYKVNGVSKYGYLAFVNNTDYMIMSSIPFGEYFGSVIKVMGMLLVVFILGAASILISMRKVAKQITKPIEELNDTAMQLAEGNLQVEIHVDSEDEIGELGQSISKTVTRLKEYIDYIEEISAVLEQMAAGKLKVDLKYAYTGEFQKVKEALYMISESMIKVMTNISESSSHVSAGADDLANAAQGLAEGAETQASAVEELVATATTVAQQVEENRNEAEKSAENTKQVTDMMVESQNLMNQMMEAMNHIHETSQKVVGIATTIEDIAEQTNLLSLNASIEAARAGEAGRGFAVVAGEIGNLANESARAVNNTRNLIGLSMQEIEKGNALAEDVLKSLSLAVEKIEDVNAMIQKSAENAEVQMRSMNQIRDGVEQISQGVQDNSAMAEESSATSQELAAQAITLNELVQQFELE